MKAKVYDLVYEGLREYPQLRNSDRHLIWYVWYKQGLIEDQYITKENFLQLSATTETIRRARARIQSAELDKVLEGELRIEDSVLASESVKKARVVLAEMKGSHIYSEQVNVVGG